MPAGGYQRPAAPAPVSGPGALSKRTDSGPAQKIRELPNAQYGEAAEFRTLQQDAPLAQTPAPATGGSPAGGGAGVSLAALTDPTADPNESVTAMPRGLPGDPDDVVGKLVALYQLHPSEDLRELIERLDG